MSFTTICPSCDARLTAPDTVLGKKVKCKKCDEPFVARRAPADDEVEDRPPQPAPRSRPARESDDDDAPVRKPARARRPVEDEAGDEPRPKARKKGKKKQKGSPVLLFVLIGVGALVLLGGGGAAAYFGFLHESDKKTPLAGDGSKGPPAPPPGPKGAVGGLAAAGAWVEHVDADGQYRINFPGRPTTQNQTVTVDGVQQTLKVTQFQAGIEVFVANAVALPKDQNLDPEQLLNIAEQQAPSRVPNSTITGKEPVTHAGVNGRQLTMTIQSPAGPVNGVVRLFVTNGRMYTFAVVGPGLQPSSPNAVKYFESLKFE